MATHWCWGSGGGRDAGTSKEGKGREKGEGGCEGRGEEGKGCQARWQLTGAGALVGAGMLGRAGGDTRAPLSVCRGGGGGGGVVKLTGF